MIETMTLNEAASYLRDQGLRISNVSLGDGIRQGKFPFGLFIQTGESGVFHIYKRMLDEWVKEREAV